MSFNPDTGSFQSVASVSGTLPNGQFYRPGDILVTLGDGSRICVPAKPTSVIANDDGEFVVTAGGSININLATNDENPEGTGPIEIIAVDGQDITAGPVTTADGIIIELESDGSLFVDPGTAPAGSYDVIYGIADPEGDEDEAAFTVVVLPNTVVAVDDGPESVIQGRTITLDLTANDSDPEGDTFTITSSDLTTLPPGLVATDNGDGTFSYTPDVTVEPGEYTHTYEITDSNGNTDTSNVVITVLQATNLRVTTTELGVFTQLAEVTVGYEGSLRCDGGPATDDDCYITEWYVEDADRTYEPGIDGSAVETGRTVKGLRNLVAIIEQCPSAGTIVFDWAGSFITDPLDQTAIEAEFSGTNSLVYNKATIDDIMKGVTTYGGGGASIFDQRGAPVARAASARTDGGGVADIVVPATSGTDYLGDLGFLRIEDYGGEVFREGAEHVFLGRLKEGDTGLCPGLESENSEESYVRKGAKRIKATPTSGPNIASVVGTNNNLISASISDTQFGVAGYGNQDHLNASTSISNGILWHDFDNENGEATIDLGVGSGPQPWISDVPVGEQAPDGDYVVSHSITFNNGMTSTNQRWHTLPRNPQVADSQLQNSGGSGPRNLNFRVTSGELYAIEYNNIPSALTNRDEWIVVNDTARIYDKDSNNLIAENTYENLGSNFDTSIAVSFYPPTINIEQRYIVEHAQTYVPYPDVILISTTEMWVVETY